MEPDTVRRLFETTNWEKLGALTDEEVGRWLVALLQEYEHAYPEGDFDRLIGIGVTAMNARHENADMFVLRWLVENPSSARLDLVATLLHGLWLDSARRKPVSAEAVDLLLRARGGLVPDEQALYDYGVALTKVMGSDAPVPAKRRVADELAALLRRDSNHPAFQEMLKPLIYRVLAT